MKKFLKMFLYLDNLHSGYVLAFRSFFTFMRDIITNTLENNKGHDTVIQHFFH